MKPRKTWKEKLEDSKDLPRVEIIPERLKARWGTGTFVIPWISAHAAEELRATRPNARVTPYWRTLKTGGILNEKYPGGVAQQKRLLEAEGHIVKTKGKHYQVVDSDQSLFDFGMKAHQS